MFCEDVRETEKKVVFSPCEGDFYGFSVESFSIETWKRNCNHMDFCAHF